MNDFEKTGLTKEFLATLLDSVPLPIYIKDSRFKYLGANRAFEEFFGKDRDYILGKTVFDILPREQAESVSARDEELMEQGGTQVYESRVDDFFGNLHEVVYHKSVFTGPKGENAGIIGVILDVTGQKQAEERLKESERRFRSLYENSILGIFRSTPDGALLMANPAFIGMLGYKSFADLAKLDIARDIYRQPSTRELFKAAMERYGEVAGFEAEWRRKDGTTLFVRESARLVRDSRGRVMYFEGTTEDITERKEAENALRALTLRQEAILAAVPEIIMEVDNDKVYRWANRHGIDFFGEDCIGKEAAHYFEGEQKIYEAVKPLFDGRENYVYLESWQRRRDGRKRLLAWHCTTLKDAAGNVVGALSSARDITDIIKK